MSSASPAWGTSRRHGCSSRRCSGTLITWDCTARNSGPRRSTSATFRRRSPTWRSSAPLSISTDGSRRLATPGDQKTTRAEPSRQISLLDPLVLGSARVVLGVRRHHREHGFVLIFGNSCRPRGSRRTVSQLAVLKIELTLSDRATCGQCSIASVRRDDQCCAILSPLSRDPALPASRQLLDVDDVLLFGNSIERR